MSDLTKHMSALFPGPIHTAKHLLRSGLTAFFPFYHAVSDQALPHLKFLYSPPGSARFETDLDYLLGYFEPVRMTDFLEESKPVHRSKPCMVLSFDDGLIQCHQEIVPLLLKKGIPATFFLNNDFIDNKGLFFRFKVSLLLELLPQKTEAEREKAASILQCPGPDLPKRLMDLSYLERELADSIAEHWNYSFEEYLSKHPVYLSSKHIREMLEAGFEIGSHGFDHPLFSMLSHKECLNHIRWSTEDLQTRFGLEYKYFSFPFTDFGIRDLTIEELFQSGIIDAGFGTAGLKEDKWKNYFQRVPMEFRRLNAKQILRGELNRRRIRRGIGKNRTER